MARARARVPQAKFEKTSGTASLGLVGGDVGTLTEYGISSSGFMTDENWNHLSESVSLLASTNIMTVSATATEDGIKGTVRFRKHENDVCEMSVDIPGSESGQFAHGDVRREWGAEETSVPSLMLTSLNRQGQQSVTFGLTSTDGKRDRLGAALRVGWASFLVTFWASKDKTQIDFSVRGVYRGQTVYMFESYFLLD